ncbi:MAG: nucleoside hydrolase [Thermoanaerobaculia bacterium]
MRSLVIDTDTASDDAVALLLAVRSPEVTVRAVTVVAGNVPLELGTRNALLSLVLAGGGVVAFYACVAREMVRELETAQHVHGEDGLAGVPLPPPSGAAEDLHAVDALRRIARDEPGRHVLVTLGPLSNVATALLLDPELLTRFAHTYCMAGAFDGVGNVHATGEYNVWVDPEAAAMVLAAPGDKTFIGWDVSRRYAVVTPDEQRRLRELGPLGRFTVDVNRCVDEFARTHCGLAGFDLPDPIATAIAIDPGLVRRRERHHVIIGLDDRTRGGTFIDHRPLAPPANAEVVWEVDEAGFKERLFRACSEDPT